MRSAIRKVIVSGLLLLTAAGRVAGAEPAFGERYAMEVLPSQAKHIMDEQTGAELLFLTSDNVDHENLYFHERSWLQDSSMILFNVRGDKPGHLGFLTATEELLRLTAADGTPLARGTCTLNRPTFFAMAGNRVMEIALEIEASPNPSQQPSKVWARERVLCEMKDSSGSVNESCDGRFLSIGGKDTENPNSTAIYTISTTDGSIKRICGMPPGTSLNVSHVQWSMTNPNWISFANAPIRIWVVDIRDGKPWAPYDQHPGELVTHEAWWVNDQMIFCGGIHPKPQEDAHVKILDPRTGQTRIIGEGAWWPTATAEELARRNWWHPSGSYDGRWVAGDNWYGDIMLFEGLTSRPRLLTTNHRTYGGGEHPEVGWDRKGDQLIFASHKLGQGVHACVATIPAAWQDEVRQLGHRIESDGGK